MSEDQAERLIKLQTAMLGELSELNDRVTRIETSLSQTGQQLAYLIAGELFEVPQGKAN